MTGFFARLAGGDLTFDVGQASHPTQLVLYQLLDDVGPVLRDGLAGEDALERPTASALTVEPERAASSRAADRACSLSGEPSQPIPSVESR